MKKIMGFLTLLLWSFSAIAQNSETVEIYFDQGSSTIDRGYTTNSTMLDRLSDKLTRFSADSTIKITKIKIESSTSPEGSLESNSDLSQRRAQVVYDFINSLNLNLPTSLLEIYSNGIAWGELRQLVYSDSDMPEKEQVIKIIDEIPEETWQRVNANDRWLSLVDSRNKQLMDLKYGNPYRYMLTNIYPSLRKSSIVTIYFQKEIEPIMESAAVVDAVETESEPKIEPEPEFEPEPETEIKPLLALKTNLLYDAVTALNIELEVPIGTRWSVAGELVFPWWSSSDKESSKRNCFQLLNGNVEGKYWFGDRTDRLVMTGWHLGLYAGGGLYDLERNKEGYQGEFFIAAGLSGGYAHTIFKSKIPNGNLRMEYSVAVGYLKTDYDKYAEHWGIDNSWHTIRQESGNYTWIGPTRAKVSLVWMFNRKVNKEN